MHLNLKYLVHNKLIYLELYFVTTLKFNGEVNQFYLEFLDYTLQNNTYYFYASVLNLM